MHEWPLQSLSLNYQVLAATPEQEDERSDASGHDYSAPLSHDNISNPIEQ
jgi:hypothetical protein